MSCVLWAGMDQSEERDAQLPAAENQQPQGLTADQINLSVKKILWFMWYTGAHATFTVVHILHTVFHVYIHIFVYSYIHSFISCPSLHCAGASLVQRQ